MKSNKEKSVICILSFACSHDKTVQIHTILQNKQKQIINGNCSSKTKASKDIKQKKKCSLSNIFSASDHIQTLALVLDKKQYLET